MNYSCPIHLTPLELAIETSKHVFLCSTSSLCHSYVKTDDKNQIINFEFKFLDGVKIIYFKNPVNTIIYLNTGYEKIEIPLDVNKFTLEEMVRIRKKAERYLNFR